jgi:hypothetical protein
MADRCLPHRTDVRGGRRGARGAPRSVDHPPVLVGLWIWSTEFDWARRFFLTFKEKAQATWAHAKRHPTSSTLITVGGLAAAAAALWAVGHFHLVDRLRNLVGL